MSQTAGIAAFPEKTQTREGLGPGGKVRKLGVASLSLVVLALSVMARADSHSHAVVRPYVAGTGDAGVVCDVSGVGVGGACFNRSVFGSDDVTVSVKIEDVTSRPIAGRLQFVRDRAPAISQLFCGSVQDVSVPSRTTDIAVYVKEALPAHHCPLADGTIALGTTGTITATFSTVPVARESRSEEQGYVAAGGDHGVSCSYNRGGACFDLRPTDTSVDLDVADALGLPTSVTYAWVRPDGTYVARGSFCNKTDGIARPYESVMLVFFVSSDASSCAGGSTATAGVITARFTQGDLVPPLPTLGGRIALGGRDVCSGVSPPTCHAQSSLTEDGAFRDEFGFSADLPASITGYGSITSNANSTRRLIQHTPWRVADFCTFGQHRPTETIRVDLTDITTSFVSDGAEDEEGQVKMSVLLGYFDRESGELSATPLASHVLVQVSRSVVTASPPSVRLEAPATLPCYDEYYENMAAGLEIVVSLDGYFRRGNATVGRCVVQFFGCIGVFAGPPNTAADSFTVSGRISNIEIL